VLLIVNVASECGYTPQYKGLEQLHEKYGEKGLVVMGFPCNQFGGQEPGSESDIKQFCESKYNVKFPMFSKIDVNGPKAAPLYQYLPSKDVPVKDQGPVKWNFEKFLVGRDGRVLARFRSGDKPTDAKMTQAIEAALGHK
jgi:glutathione peroxidase